MKRRLNRYPVSCRFSEIAVKRKSRESFDIILFPFFFFFFFFFLKHTDVEQNTACAVCNVAPGTTFWIKC